MTDNRNSAPPPEVQAAAKVVDEWLKSREAAAKSGTQSAPPQMSAEDRYRARSYKN